MEQIKLEESRKAQAVKPKRRPAPKFANKPTVKSTTSAILREERIYAKQEEKSMKELELLLQGGRDLSEFNEWKETVEADKKAAEESKRIESIIQAKISREDAILAKQREIDLKRLETDELKIERAELMKRKEKADAKELIKIKKRIAEIAEADKNANLARLALQDEKSKLVKLQQREQDELMKRKEKEEMADMAKKKQMIKEIRELEAEIIENRANYKADLDMTETAGHALLGEMSLLELRERLALTKEKHEEEEKQKREEIKEDKKRLEIRLQLAHERVNAHRELKMKAQAAEKAKIPLIKPVSNSKLDEMRQLLEDKKRERMFVQSNNSSTLTSRKPTPTRMK